MKEVETLKPFTKFLMTLGQLPSSYLISMTYEEQLLWFCNFLQNQVIPTVNNNAEAVIELQQYISNYFNNLDVQEEINNKLDDMVEAGTLQEIISEYLNSIAIFGFDTVDDMKSATNLINGSFAKTLGFHTINDGGGATYKILESATPNNMTILTLDSGLYAELIEDNYYIKAKQLGAYCDKTTDDVEILQNIINYCKENNRELLIEGYCYVSDTIDTKGISIKGKGKRPYPMPTLTSNTYGYLGWDYLRNTGDGALVTFEDYVDSMLTSGSGIISDIANPIIKCNTDNGKFILKDLSIVGWLRTENQIGIKSTYTSDSAEYINGKHKFENISVFNCGGDGINVQSIELTNINNCDFSYNFGHGIYIEEVEGFDCPFEYASFNQCRISGNKLGGIYGKNSFRKGVEINKCIIGRNGLYQQLGITPPANLDEMISGITIDGRTSYNNEEQRDFTVNNCNGEEQNLMIKIMDYESGRIFNNINITNNIQYPSSNETIDSIAYIDTYYTRTLNYYNNNSVSSNPNLVFSANPKTIIPNIVDKIFYTQYNNVPTLTINSKITVTKQQIYKYGNLIFVNILGTTNDEITGYTDLVSNLPLPIDTYYPDINIDNHVVRGAVYANGGLQVPSAIENNKSININLVYFVNYQS